MRLILIFLPLILASSAWADQRDALASEIENAATHAEADERHTAEINGCQMTTFRWRNRPEHGWVLWTSFQFDMSDAVLDENKLIPTEKYVYAEQSTGQPETGFGVVAFTMKPGTLAQQERSVLREPSQEAKPSPRADGTTHYFEYRSNFFFSLKGQGVLEKVRSFTTLYDKYVSEFCVFAS